MAFSEANGTSDFLQGFEALLALKDGEIAEKDKKIESQKQMLRKLKQTVHEMQVELETANNKLIDLKEEYEHMKSYHEEIFKKEKIRTEEERRGLAATIGRLEIEVRGESP